jgi:DNA-binding beta-propeller fold protein YncE
MMRVVAGLTPRCVRGVAVVLTAGLCLAAWSSCALAAKGVLSTFGSSGPGDGQFSSAAGVAVNTASGEVYVVDQFQHRVERFDASGAFLGAFGWGVVDGNPQAETCSSSCQAGLQGSGAGQFDTPTDVAVDQADGSIYVLDTNNSRVEEFDASGTYQSQFGSAGSAEGQLSIPAGLAVDPTDRSVYVADMGNNRVQKFDSSGGFVRTFGFGVADGSSSSETCTSSCQIGLAVGDEGGFNTPTRVAVDSTGRVYVLDAGNGRIERYTSANSFDQVFDATDVFAPQEIVVGPENDHLYVAQWSQDFSEQHVIEIDSSGSLMDTHGIGSTATSSAGLAVGAGAQRLYLADDGNARVFILDDIPTPTLTNNPAVNITSDSASLSGSVTPNGSPTVGWHFEISTDDVNWGAVAADEDAGNGSTPVPVSENLSGLVPNTTYFVRLAAIRRFNSPTYSSESQFTTTAITPTVITDAAQDVSLDHATLEGRINPNNSSATFYFEYGTTTAYGVSLPATQDANAGAAYAIEPEIQSVYNLQPATTYHYRLVATNSIGTTHGADETFTTTGAPHGSTSRARIPGSPFLPDDRGWEKVSPGDKNGSDVMPDSGRSHVAIDGSAAQFSSLGAFGDAIGTGVATDYVSVRNANTGWTTHAVTPRQAPTPAQPLLRGLQSLYLGFSPDLSKGVFLGWSPVTPDPNVANVANLYLRDDAKAPGAALYQLVTACPLCGATDTPLPPLNLNTPADGQPRFAGASADYGHVLFESQEPLTTDAPSGCTNLANVNQCPVNLYEWDHGTVRLAGMLPACSTPPCPIQRSIAGQGAGASQGSVVLTPHTISGDGSRIFFTAPDAPRSRSGALYMRVNHTVTVQLNASERTSPDPGGQASATFWDASADGLRVFFTSSEELTNDAPAGTTKLYMYDASKPDSDSHNLTLVSVDAEPGDTGSVINVQGASSNGHYVYFAAAGELVSGQPLLGTERALYVWHDGTIRYITRMQGFDDDIEDSNTALWAFNRPTARVTPDGLHLLFSSSEPGAGPTGYDQGHCADAISTGCREFYLYTYDAQRLACVSCNPSGAAATASAFTAERITTSGAATSPAQNHPLSDDGRRVFFSTREALVSSDVNGRVDVYEYQVPSGTVHLLSDGVDRADSYFLDASPSGDDVTLVTRAQLVSLDEDSNYDMYDARVTGGFTEPLPAARACTGDACQGSQSRPPESPARGSSLITGRSALPKGKPKARAKRKAKCRKGFVRKRARGKTRCVKHRPTRKTHPAGAQAHAGGGSKPVIRVKVHRSDPLRGAK